MDHTPFETGVLFIFGVSRHCQCPAVVELITLAAMEKTTIDHLLHKYLYGEMDNTLRVKIDSLLHAIGKNCSWADLTKEKQDKLARELISRYVSASKGTSRHGRCNVILSTRNLTMSAIALMLIVAFHILWFIVTALPGQ